MIQACFGGPQVETCSGNWPKMARGHWALLRSGEEGSHGKVDIGYIKLHEGPHEGPKQGFSKGSQFHHSQREFIILLTDMIIWSLKLQSRPDFVFYTLESGCKQPK